MGEADTPIRRALLLVWAIVALGPVVLLGAGGARSAAARSTETIRALPITVALRAEIRASFYRAYLADPREFSVPARLPISAVIEASLTNGAVIDGAMPAESSTWVIGAVCMRTPIACQDAGAFQVFYRTALTGSFVYWSGGLCDLPAVLAARWFPGGHYPLGIVCPAGGVLVRRGGMRPGAWTALVPRSWIHVAYGAVHLGDCGTAALPRLNPELCSFEGGDTDIDIWFDPSDTNERLTVATCRGGDCFPPTATFAPKLVLPRGAEIMSRVAAWELGYSEAHGMPPLESASDGVTTLLLASHSRGRVSYPVYTATVELPPSRMPLAAAIVDSFATP